MTLLVFKADTHGLFHSSLLAGMLIQPLFKRHFGNALVILDRNLEDLVDGFTIRLLDTSQNVTVQTGQNVLVLSLAGGVVAHTVMTDVLLLKGNISQLGNGSHLLSILNVQLHQLINTEQILTGTTADHKLSNIIGMGHLEILQMNHAVDTGTAIRYKTGSCGHIAVAHEIVIDTVDGNVLDGMLHKEILL